MSQCAKLVNALHHVGWVVPDKKRFEKFWCGLLGFELCHTGELTKEKTKELFNRSIPAKVYRYKRDGFNLELEIHVFDEPRQVRYADAFISKFCDAMGSNVYNFTTPGINHVCLTIEDRDKFLEELPEDVERRIYDDPRGWQNIFIKDYDHHWIELRTPPKE